MLQPSGDHHRARGLFDADSIVDESSATVFPLISFPNRCESHSTSMSAQKEQQAIIQVYKSEEDSTRRTIEEKSSIIFRFNNPGRTFEPMEAHMHLKTAGDITSKAEGIVPDRPDTPQPIKGEEKGPYDSTRRQKVTQNPTKKPQHKAQKHAIELKAAAARRWLRSEEKIFQASSELLSFTEAY
jgi:hypothetical protein